MRAAEVNENERIARVGWVALSGNETVRLTVKRLTRAARALEATAARHAACPHLEVRDAGGVTPLKYR